MGEKKGSTVKLIYDFPTQNSTEVFLENIGWVRVTCREFRSYNAPRRVIYWNKNEQTIKDYEGPLYLYMTNHIIHNPTEKGIQYVDGIRPQNTPRPYGG
jgi:hypothetical protein